jgi:SHS2 domain-containing protein
MGIRKRKFRGTVMTTQVREVEVEIECNDDDDLLETTIEQRLCQAASPSGGCFETDVDDVEEIDDEGNPL